MTFLHNKLKKREVQIEKLPCILEGHIQKRVVTIQEYQIISNFCIQIEVAISHNRREGFHCWYIESGTFLLQIGCELDIVRCYNVF